MSTPDRPDPGPEYVTAIEQALAVVWEPRCTTPRASLRPAPRTTPAPRTRLAVARRAIRTALPTVLALAALAGGSLLGAAVVVDWWAPTTGPSACSEVALPLVLGVVVLGVLGLAGSVVRELRARREGSAP